MTNFPEDRCAPWTKRQGIDPIGSAGRYDAFVLVEFPLPWPSDISALPEFAAIVVGPLVRVQAVVPQTSPNNSSARFTIWSRSSSNRWTGFDYETGITELPEMIAGALAEPDVAKPRAVALAPNEIIICTHGTRDVCCGGLGTKMHADVEHRWSGVRVRRTSHTGGHRFAPTAYTFPDGRGWAYIDAQLLDAVVLQRGNVAALRQEQRGATIVDEFAQPLERAAFERVGWEWLDCTITDVRVQFRNNSGESPSANVALDWSNNDGRVGHADGVVSVSRQIPVLVCGSPIEAAIKTSNELILSDVHIAW